MAIYQIHQGKLRRVTESGFSDEGIRERHDLQRMLREEIEIISPDTMVIAEEFCDWGTARGELISSDSIQTLIS